MFATWYVRWIIFIPVPAYFHLIPPWVPGWSVCLLPPIFNYTSIPHAAWWGIVTLTTAGYGDMFPVTMAGKLVGCLALLCGLIVMSLPIPSVVSQFSFFYEKERNRQAHCARESEASKRVKDALKGVAEGVTRKLSKYSSLWFYTQGEIWKLKYYTIFSQNFPYTQFFY